MCYYNSLKLRNEEFIKVAEIGKQLTDIKLTAIQLSIGFDYCNYPVLKAIPGAADFEIVEMEWGFIPHYIRNRKDLEHFRKGGINPKTGKFDVPVITLNAIGEELFQKPTYQQAARERRCLVLSSGFFEWRHIFPLNKRTGVPVKTAVKYPYYITLPGKPYFFMAGIWTPWVDKDSGEYVESFAVVTTKANSLMEQVHNSKKRMPAILPDSLAYEWLFGNPDEKRITEIVSTPYPAELMQATSIAKDFRNLPDPGQQVEYHDLPPLVAV